MDVCNQAMQHGEWPAASEVAFTSINTCEKVTGDPWGLGEIRRAPSACEMPSAAGWWRAGVSHAGARPLGALRTGGPVCWMGACTQGPAQRMQGAARPKPGLVTAFLPGSPETWHKNENALHLPLDRAW